MSGEPDVRAHLALLRLSRRRRVCRGGPFVQRATKGSPGTPRSTGGAVKPSASNVPEAPKWVAHDSGGGDPMPSAGGSKRATIADVARSAGVSTSAVSKVLTNAYGVSPAMRERVRAAMAELDYRPYAAARGMRGRAYTIGVLLASIRNAFYADLLESVDATLRNGCATATPPRSPTPPPAHCGSCGPRQRAPTTTRGTAARCTPCPPTRPAYDPPSPAGRRTTLRSRAEGATPLHRLQVAEISVR